MADRSGSSPTPEERAEIIVTRLERYIRDHRTLSRGVSFRKWQELAKNEIIAMAREMETQHERDHRWLDRALMVFGAGLATVGVWGTALALAAAPNRTVAAVLTVLGGLVILYMVGALGLRSPLKRFQMSSTRAAIGRIRTFHKQVKDLEDGLKKRRKALERDLDDDGSDA